MPCHAACIYIVNYAVEAAHHNYRCAALSASGSIVVAGGFSGVPTTLNVVEDGTHRYRFRSDTEMAVKRVHLSLDSSRLAVGGETGGRGVVQLYDTNLSDKTPEMLHEWPMPKPVWSVKLSPSGGLLAVAGYDSTLTLFDAHTCEQLRTITYAPTLRGPYGPIAFIWSTDFSRNGKYLALGCWNGGAYVYRVEDARAQRGHPPTAAMVLSAFRKPSTAKPPSATAAPAADATTGLIVAEVTNVMRKNRVYSVSMDATGRYMAVGGRDSAVALYDLSPRGGGGGELTATDPR